MKSQIVGLQVTIKKLLTKSEYMESTKEAGFFNLEVKVGDYIIP